MIRKLKEQGIVRDSNSEWASPLIIVKPPDGSTRIVDDFQKLNANCIPDPYPVPQNDDSIDQTGNLARQGT